MKSQVIIRMTQDRQFQNRNLPDQLADHIVDWLATGKLARGDRIYEKELCLRLNVSRIPLREALRILQAQGVVRTEPNRGTFLTGFENRDILEAQEVRVSVERIALRRLLKIVKTSPSVLDHLDEAIDRMRNAALVKDNLEFCRADLFFHSRIVDLSGSAALRPIWEVLSRATLVFMMQEPTLEYNQGAVINDHVRLRNLLQEGRWAPLEKEISIHITTPLGNRKLSTEAISR